MARVCHVIAPNHRSLALNHLVAVELAAYVSSREPDTEVHRLRLAAATYWSPARRRQKERSLSATFTRAREFWAWSIDRLPSRSRAIVICHSGSYEMRLLDMFDQLPALGFELRRLSLDEPPFIAVWSERCDACTLANAEAGQRDLTRRRKGCTASKHRSIHVWASHNFTTYSLERLSQSIGISPQAMSTKRVSATVQVNTLIARANCLSAWFRAWCSWLTTNDLGILSPTIASQSWHSYRHRFMDTPIYVHDNSEVVSMERRAYFGGRCECRILGDWSGPQWVQVDFNSLYPWVMAHEKMPHKLLTTRSYPTIEKLKWLCARYCLVADVTVDCDTPLFPARRKAGVVHPVGRFKTTLCTPELRLALARGVVRDCTRVAVYDGAVLFGRFVAELWALRRAAQLRGDDVGDLICKLLMNALYGKFAQRATRWEPCGDCPVDEVGQSEVWDTRRQRWRVFRSVGGRVYERVPADEGDDSFPAIAAHITSGARVRLLGALERVGRFEVAYVDTDGFILDGDALHKLSDLLAPESLGGLRRVDASDRLVVMGPKWYRLGDKQVCKGLTLDAAWLSAKKVLDWRTHGLAWGIEGHVLDRVIRQRIEQNFSKEFDAGAVDENGRVYPLVLH